MKRLIRYSLLASATALSVMALDGDPFEGTARARESACDIPAAQIVSFGGSVIASPRVVPIFFAGDPLAAQTQDFLTKFVGNHAVKASLAEYGVGPAEIAPAVTLTEPPPASIPDDEISTWLAGKAGTPGFPDDGRSVFLVVYPAGTHIPRALVDGADACAFGGTFHGVFTNAAGEDRPMVVSPRCDGSYLGVSGIDQVTATASAELADAMTNPFFDAYNSPNIDGSSAVFSSFLTEVAEFCQNQPDAVVKLPSIGYAITRMWSNRAAAAGGQPCLPAPPGERYFNAYPVGLEGTMVTPFNVAKAISVPPGGEVTIPIRLFGDRDAPRTWELSTATNWIPYVPNVDTGNGELTLSFDRTTGKDGDTRYLTVKRAPARPGDPSFDPTFAIVSTSGGEKHAWIVGVGD